MITTLKTHKVEYIPNEEGTKNLVVSLVDLALNSSDTKPTDVMNGSMCIEVDTGSIFIYDEENEEWNKVGSGGGGDTPSKAKVTFYVTGGIGSHWSLYTYSQGDSVPPIEILTIEESPMTIPIEMVEETMILVPLDESYMSDLTVEGNAQIGDSGITFVAITGDCTISYTYNVE